MGFVRNCHSCICGMTFKLQQSSVFSSFSAALNVESLLGQYLSEVKTSVKPLLVRKYELNRHCSCLNNVLILCKIIWASSPLLTTQGKVSNHNCLACWISKECCKKLGDAYSESQLRITYVQVKAYSIRQSWRGEYLFSIWDWGGTKICKTCDTHDVLYLVIPAWSATHIHVVKMLKRV